MLEDAAAKLSQLSANHDLEVVAARTLEDQKIATLEDGKKEFGVNLGLTVSLEQSNDLVRASYSLTDAKSGKNLAGDSITAPVSDLFTSKTGWPTPLCNRSSVRKRQESCPVSRMQRCRSSTQVAIAVGGLPDRGSSRTGRSF
jgi:hypothetical protein